MVENTCKLPFECERKTPTLEAYAEPCQTSKIKRLTKCVNGSKLLTIFAKRSILIV